MVHTFPHLQGDPDFYFDREAADTVVEFIENFCKLSDPKGQPFILLPWQRQVVEDVFGWKRADNGERRFTSVYIECPRKQGKSFFVSALSLYLAIADGVDNAEVYLSAVTREQSGILFKGVRQMRDQSEWLRDRLELVEYKSEAHYRKNGTRTGSFLKALSGESEGAHGKYASAVLCDELHEWQGRKAELLYEALISGFGNRRSPLVIHITTAGFGGQPTLAKRLHDKAKVFEEGRLEDPSFYGVVYGLDPAADWTDEANWRLANPSWELSVKNLRREFLKAKSDKSYENTFRRLFLDQWTAQKTRWLDMASWSACSKPVAWKEMAGRDAILGVDLGQTYDLTAVAIILPDDDGHWTIFARHYMPAQQVAKRTAEDSIPYDQWVDSGILTATVGASRGLTVDYDAIAHDILDIAAHVNVKVVAFDPAGFHVVNPVLENAGLDTMPILQSYRDMSPGSKELERRLTAGEVTVAENALLTWEAGNVEVEHKDGLIKPTKPNSGGSYKGSASAKFKVDGIVAAVIASQACLLTVGKPQAEPEAAPVGVFFVKR